jgi:uncharacterized membrane protein YgaE (UPF0421/DUF939 family)
MLPEHFERPALLRLIQSSRRTTRQTLAVATIFAVQAVICALVLTFAYARAHAAGAYWAIVSAVLVLQPGIEQSISASAIRIAANLIGAATGLAVGWAFGTGVWQVPLAMVIVCYICEFLRLDLGLRTACVSVVIVMLANEGRVTTTSLERVVAVLVGCVFAVVLQILFDRVGCWLRRRSGASAGVSMDGGTADQE